MVVEWLDIHISEWGSVRKRWLCGDDVDLTMSSSKAAALFMLLIGNHWRTNPVKQMVSYSDHEFLQRLPDEKIGVIAPIASMLSSLASG